MRRTPLATDRDLADVRAVTRIFDADWAGTSPDLACTRLVVSPVNSKDRILAVIESATTSLHVESLELADPAWNRSSTNGETAKALLKEGIPVRWIPKSTMLVHVKSILVDGARAYMGSENLTSTSLEKNREIGLVVTDAAPLATMERTFEADFASARPF